MTETVGRHFNENMKEISKKCENKNGKCFEKI